MTETAVKLKQFIRQAFSKAAESYDQAAFLQHEVLTRLIERLSYIKLKPNYILDVGSGTGNSSLLLSKEYPKSNLISLDIAHPMLVQAKKLHRGSLYCCGDMESLPFQEKTFDLILSSCTFQWSVEIQRTLQSSFNALSESGLLLFASFGPDTLQELRESWSSVDKFHHTNEFLDMHHLGDFLLQQGFSDPVVDRENLIVTYKDAKTLMQDLKHIGANRLLSNNRKTLTGKNRFELFEKAYNSFRNQDYLLPVTYEVIYGLAWKNKPSDHFQGIWEDS